MNATEKEIVLKSSALMTGLESEARVRLSETGGIRFHYNGKTVEAGIENVLSTEHCVVIGNNGVKIMLIEHFMAACAVCGISGADIYLSHYELPILDGSSKIWVEAFKNAGAAGGNNKRYRLREPLIYQNGKTHLIMLPSDNLNVTYSVNYNHKDLKNRWISLDMNKLDEYIEARTFGYLDELEMLQKAGYGRGADIENTLGLKDGGYTSELKSEFEPIKHKILDLIGDFYLAGCNILNLKADIIVKEAGHTVHIKTAGQLKDKLIMEE